MISTNVDGKKLSQSYSLKYSLEEAFKDWFKDCDEKVLE